MRVWKSCQTLVLILLFLFLVALSPGSLSHASAPVSLEKKSAKILPKKLIDDLLTRPSLKSASMSIQIVSLPEGKILYERYADIPMIPASNMKLVTMAAALRELGPSYTFRTEIYAKESAPKNGRLKDVWIKGYGDPFLTKEALQDMVHQLAVSGVKAIDGSLYLDETYFDHDGLTAYISEEDDLLHTIVTSTLPSDHSSKPRIQKDDPDLDTGRKLLKMLRANGIFVTDSLRREAVPKDSFLILTHRSLPLSEILKRVGKCSDNFIAEQLVKTIAAQHFGPPGSLANGLSLMRDYLIGLGILEKEFVLENGSGLTRLSKMTSENFIKILFNMYVSPWKDDFREALAISGVDGTLVRKLSPRLKGKIFAKTGTLNGVTSLSGYGIDERNGEKKQFAFSFLFNDFRASLSEMARLQEDILKVVFDSL
jgi:D-alanyl-D-alanine carboxypeptidase/D-alanyl-D-alanine-endopeptidase (penicillin-binding protein 4)